MATRNGVFFTNQGEGKTALIFLHFYGGSSNTWAEVIEKLSPDFRCVAPDLSGFGKSSTPQSEITVDLQTELVLQLISELQIDNYLLVGHSMGGKIAMSAASRQPAGLKGLVLIAPSPPTPEPIEDRSKLREAFGDKPKMKELVEGLTVDPLEPALFERVLHDHLAVSARAWNDWLDEGSKEDISEKVKQVSIPVMVLNGSEDPNFTMDFLRKEIGGNMPQATFKEVAHAGHLVPLEKPEELAALIRSFVPEES